MGNDSSERKLPTRRGGWWRQGTYCPYIEEVEGADGDLFVQMTGIPVTDDGSWLAPIPGPAVCAALARYSEALDDLDALWDGADFITRNNVTNRFNDADDALHDTIRAERDGAA